MEVIRRAFTLIELLIVIAIIAILALIAVPNFLEAQVRAKVSGCMANQRSIATALEAYAVDWGIYPPGKINGDPDAGWLRPLSRRLQPLTTPVAFMSTIPRDVFRIQKHGNNTKPNHIAGDDTFDYICISDQKPNTTLWSLHKRKWRMSSAGPDMHQQWGGQGQVYAPYDPTNGTISRGDIVLLEGGGNGFPGNMVP